MTAKTDEEKKNMPCTHANVPKQAFFIEMTVRVGGCVCVYVADPGTLFSNETNGRRQICFFIFISRSDFLVSWGISLVYMCMCVRFFLLLLFVHSVVFRHLLPFSFV